MNTTFIIIKPDAIRRGLVGTILSRFEQEKWEIETIQLRYKTEDWCRAHYSHIKDPKLLGNLVDFMCGWPLIGIVLRGPDELIGRVRKIIGSVHPEPYTLRYELRVSTDPLYKNLIHASESRRARHREIALFFDKETDV